MSEIINASHVFLDCQATTVDEALDFLSAKSIELGLAKSEDHVRKAFDHREKQGSTGMVNGFAIPHAKTTAVESAAIIAVRFANEIEDWKTMDGDSVKMAVALLVPKDEALALHLQLLSKIAASLMDEGFRKKLLSSESAEDVAKAIEEGLEI